MNTLLRKKNLLRGQVFSWGIAIIPIIVISVLTQKINWIWMLFIPAIPLLFFQQRRIFYFRALSMGDPRAEDYSVENTLWEKIFWVFNFLFLFGVGDIIKLDLIVIISYFLGYTLFQIYSYKIIFLKT